MRMERALSKTSMQKPCTRAGSEQSTNWRSVVMLGTSTFKSASSWLVVIFGVKEGSGQSLRLVVPIAETVCKLNTHTMRSFSAQIVEGIRIEDMDLDATSCFGLTVLFECACVHVLVCVCV